MSSERVTGAGKHISRRSKVHDLIVRVPERLIPRETRQNLRAATCELLLAGGSLVDEAVARVERN
ncbi:MAG: hypothetical protein Q7O66_03370 [Dehalococcoidia bacterium]|nr:hypothetical protein [Dehalococcoidia bacterium]